MHCSLGLMSLVEKADRRDVCAVMARGLGAASRALKVHPDWDWCPLTKKLIAELFLLSWREVSAPHLVPYRYIQIGNAVP